MKDMRTIGVDLYTRLRINLSTHVAAKDRTLFEYKNSFAGLGQAPCNCASPNASTSYYRIYVLHLGPSL